MRTERIGLLMLALLVGACGEEQAVESTMEGNSAEDHAHMHGGMGGATDSTGATIRQTIVLSSEQQQALGVTFVTVRRMPLTRSVRTVGRIEIAEPLVVEVTPKIDGFVEVLYADATGESVRQGEPLLTIYSPALVAAQEELLTARRLVDRLEPKSGEAWHNAQTMLDAARRRFEYWDIPSEHVRQIEETGEITKVLPLVAPASGVVLEKDVIQGQRVMAGDRLFRIANLSELWVEGDVFEQDLELVRVGSPAHIEVSAYSGYHLMGRVSFVYPTMDEASRTSRVRVTVRNDEMRLKPGMFATVFFDAAVGDDVLAVPLRAVVVTGERNLVFVHHDDGSLMPHEVVLGTRAGDYVQILSGVSEGQHIVASANFLVDAESQLGTTGGSMIGMEHGEQAAVTESDSPSSAHEGHDHD